MTTTNPTVKRRPPHSRSEFAMSLTARSFASLVAIPLLLVSSAATATVVDDRLHDLAQKHGEAYVAARDALLVEAANDPTGLAESLRARARNATFVDATFLEDALALAVVARLDDAAVDRPLGALQGLDPAVYQNFRRPEPIAGRELSDKKVAPAILVEALLKTSPLRTFHDAAKEEPAYKSALLVALADSKHALALPTLVHVAKNAGAIVERATAAALLGQLGHVSARPLAELVRDAAQPDEVRTAAIVGLGRTRDPLALEILVDEAKGAEDPARVDAAIRALGVVGDAWVHAQHPTKDSDRIRRVATETLVALLPSSVGTKRTELIALSLAVIADRRALPLLDAHIAKGGALADDARLVKRRTERALSRRR